MKKIMISIVIFIMIFSIVGCTATKSEEIDLNSDDKTNNKTVDVNDDSTKVKTVDVNITVPAGSTALSMVKLIKDGVDIEGYNVNIEVIKATDLLASKVLSGESDMVLLPTNLAAKLYNKGVDYSLKSVNVWGSLFLVSAEQLTSIKDLEGKTITMIGKGLTPDILMKYILKENNVKDVEFNYVSGGSELAPLFLSGKSKISIMPEPVLSIILSKKPNTKIVLDFQKEWKSISGGDSSYPQAGIFVKNSFTSSNKEFVEKFMQKYRDASEWVNTNKEEAGIYYESLDLGLPAKVIEESIERSNIHFETALEAKDDLNKYYNVLFDNSKDSIGGKVPSEDFYGN
ncbi:ABC transporter substrate-binding protein [Helicovermis profundi]|uniref:ABC transporter substrate-binding protein n=1 Tax=Helicovermis profundi TaxID=3065157 RepID=A0AAU9E6X5_9FIRM|nr:ABC transporter substrate-binding protein [Clostridia bacterium S502]